MTLAQLKETLQAATQYRALVRSVEEAEKLRFDLAGVKLVQGELVLAKPARLDSISIIVCAANSAATTLDETFQTAFSGVTLAMLCDAEGRRRRRTDRIGELTAAAADRSGAVSLLPDASRRLLGLGRRRGLSSLLVRSRISRLLWSLSSLLLRRHSFR